MKTHYPLRSYHLRCYSRVSRVSRVFSIHRVMAPPNQSAASAASSTNVVDPLDLLDFTEYDGLPTGYQHSPSMSPPTSNKQQFPRPTSSITTPATLPSTLPSSQSMPGPSHQYDQYKQQTPFVPGALASRAKRSLAVLCEECDVVPCGTL